MTNQTRRNVLTAGVIGAVQVIVGPVNAAVTLSAADAKNFEDFLALSAALTGIQAKMLRPDVDAFFDVPREYFVQARDHDPVKFGALLAFFVANRAPDPSEQKTVIQSILNHADKQIAYLARSILLMWYFGQWYSPDQLEKAAADPNFQPLPPVLVSSLGYARGWVWKIAQAHPAGHSELQFGYWNNPPPASTAISGFIIPEVK